MDNYVLIHRLLRRLQQRNRLVGRSFETGLSLPESHFLVELDAAPNVSLTELTSILRLDQSFVSRIAGSLEQKKHLSKTRDPDDSRRRVLSLTPSGREVIRRIDLTANGHYSSMAARISAAELKQLVWLFRSVADGCKVPAASIRPSESSYRAEQRRFTRACGLLGEAVFGLPLSTSSWQVLSEVVLSKTAPPAGELASLLSIAQNSLSTVATALEARKLLRRGSGRKDGRNVFLYPTLAGKALYKKVEQKAAAMFSSALQGVNLKQLDMAIAIFQNFLGDTGTGIAPLSGSFEVALAKDRKERALARGLIARSYVKDGFEVQLPETISSSDHSTFLLKCDGVSVAALDVDTASTTVCSAGWEESVSAWILQSFIYQVIASAKQVNAAFELDIDTCPYLVDRLG